MELSDYQTPDPYAPRDKASQLYAAAKRTRPPSDEPTAPERRRYAPAGIGMAIIILFMIALASYQLSHLPAGPLVVPSVAPSVAAHAPPQRTIAPDPTNVPHAVMIDAYSAPGTLLGPIEADRAITPIAHYGSDWIQADVEGSGRVWLRAADWPGLAMTGPDLEPRPAPQTGQGMPVYQESAPEEKPASDKGQKAAPDRAVRHATAVAEGK